MSEAIMRECPCCGGKIEPLKYQNEGNRIYIDGEKIVTKCRWIPCSERLPEKAGEYLVTYHPCYWDHVEWSKRCAGIDTFRGKSTWAKKKYQRVIAWMPIPDAYEPPKE